NVHDVTRDSLSIVRGGADLQGVGAALSLLPYPSQGLGQQTKRARLVKRLVFGKRRVLELRPIRHFRSQKSGNRRLIDELGLLESLRRVFRETLVPEGPQVLVVGRHLAFAKPGSSRPA